MPIIPNKLNVSNRKNIYHLKCAMLIDMIPVDTDHLVTKHSDSDRLTADPFEVKQVGYLVNVEPGREHRTKLPDMPY